jgi:hypothetical protein
LRPIKITEDVTHDCRWDAILHIGIGRPKWHFQPVKSIDIINALKASDLEKLKKSKLINEVRNLHGQILDSSTLLWAHRNPSPYSWKKSCEDVDCRDSIRICPKNGIPLVTLVSAFILYWVCREINGCTYWMIDNPDQAHLPEGIDPREIDIVKRCAGALSKDFPYEI